MKSPTEQHTYKCVYTIHAHTTHMYIHRIIICAPCRLHIILSQWIQCIFLNVSPFVQHPNSIVFACMFGCSLVHLFIHSYVCPSGRFIGRSFACLLACFTLIFVICCGGLGFSYHANIHLICVRSMVCICSAI